ncbi:MAG: hypothetical protein IPJ11_15535 [Gemmatimonadetes bacterium]|nr:hypothetical protein [Gemmatimonadota bacterium]
MSFDRSITLAPLGTATSVPTAVKRPPCTKITAFRVMLPFSGSIRRPARMAVIGPVGARPRRLPGLQAV